MQPWKFKKGVSFAGAYNRLKSHLLLRSHSWPALLNDSPTEPYGGVRVAQPVPQPLLPSFCHSLLGTWKAPMQTPPSLADSPGPPDPDLTTPSTLQSFDMGEENQDQDSCMADTAQTAKPHQQLVTFHRPAADLKHTACVQHI